MLPCHEVHPSKGEQMMTRPLNVIAREIRGDWKKVYFGAVPYLDAMATMDKIEDPYFYDSGKSVVLYFLANATGWRGETARRVKAELKAMAKACKNTLAVQLSH
jgi:hypothetical protein